MLEFKKIAREDLEIGSAIYMNDGIINMALSNFKGKGGTAASDLKEGSTFVGAHHFGIQVDDLIETQKRIEAAGGKSSSTSATNAPATSSASSRIRKA